MKKSKGIILLSSGLDSSVSLALALEKCEIALALTFDYGQRAAEDEILFAKKTAEKYNIPHKTISLPFLKEACGCALVDRSKKLEFENLGKASMRAVWVPNRNGLFLNIAGVFADSTGADYIIFGANREEAGTFSDNSGEFVKIADEFFKFSTISHPVVFSPCQNMEKYEIVNCGIQKGIDFSLIKSCYKSKKETGRNHCGECESCKRLKKAILKSGNNYLINSIF